VTRTEGADGADSRIHVAVWTSDADPTLVAAESFGNVADMTGWLRAHPEPPDQTPTLVWTKDLRGDPGLARAVSDALGVPLPPRPPGRGRRVADANGGS
jgi:hypothetical protein